MDDIKLTPSKENKDIIQSYALTTMRSSIGLYGQRLILRLVEAANASGAVTGLDFRHGNDITQVSPAKVETNLMSESVTITMPATAILGGTEEYSKLYKDIHACMRHIISYKDTNGDFVAFPFLTYARCGRFGVKVQVRQELWDAFLNFSKGFRKFELEVALSFQSTYSLRLYQLISGQTEPLTFSIQELKEMFGLFQKDEKGRIVREKYKDKPTDFIKRVIDPAKEELDQCSPYTFEYEPLVSQTGKVGRSGITGIRFFPVRQAQFRDKNLEDKNLIGKYNLTPLGLTKEHRKFLKEKFGFDDKGIQANYKLWETLHKNRFDITQELDILAVRVARLRPDNPPGYIIKSLNGILRDAGIKKD